ncbi:MAG: hypothetical protein IAF02_11265 [Anaerolineae bacterium]|nr:hypothetical protein [Anaerolineae bacterium]
MTNKIRVILRNQLTLILEHTLTDVLSATGNYHINKTGTGSFSVPYTPTVEALLIQGVIAEANTTYGVNITSLIIKSVDLQINNGKAVLVVSGPTLDAELNYYNVFSNTIGNGAGGRSNSSDITRLMAYVPDWGANLDYPFQGTATGTNLVGKGESVLQMLRQAQEQSGEIFTVSSVAALRSIAWHRTPKVTGITFKTSDTPNADYFDPQACLIASLSRDTRISELVTRIIPTGAGLGATALTLKHVSAANRAIFNAAWPDYTINYDSNLITNNTAELTHLPVTRPVQFGNIEPESSTTANLENASIALLNASLRWLEARKGQTSLYKIRVLPNLYHQLLPGHQVDVDYQKDNVSITKTLIILDITFSANLDALVYADCTLAEEIVQPPEDSDFVAAKLAQTSTIINHATASTYVPLPSGLIAAAWDGTTKTSANNGTIDLSSVFGLPANIKAVTARLAVKSASLDHRLTLGPSSTATDQLVCRTQNVNQLVENSGIINCDDNGDIYAYVVGTITVYLRIWGYWI